MKVIVSGVRAGDIDDYVKIYSRGAGYTLSEARRILKRKPLKNMIKASLGNVSAGFLNFCIKGHTLYICDIDVAKKFRRHGVGSALIYRAIRTAKSWTLHRISLHVNVKNRGAISFYKRNGFTMSKKVIKCFYEKEDAFLVTYTIR